MTSPLHAATPRRTACHGFSALVVLRSVDAPRLERENVGGGEAASQKFHDSSFFFSASFVCVNAGVRSQRAFSEIL